jgi:ABC-type nitrate/sulfonate/bicarbonate transport system substrate-binding protein
MTGKFHLFGGWTRRSVALFAVATLVAAVWTRPASAEDNVKISVFKGSFVSLPIYIASDLHLFDKHGVKVELVYGTGIQVTNILVSGAAQFGAFAVEHGLLVRSKGQNVKLLLVAQAAPPFDIIVRNNVPTPNAGKPYPAPLKDLKGLRVGISSPGASTDEALQYMLRQAGLNPATDVRLVPVGGPTTQLAGLKNGLIDADMAFDPVQMVALHDMKIARSILDVEGGQGPALFRPFAYNGVWAHASYIKAHPAAAEAVVAAIVEAEQMINDPKQIDQVVKLAADNMRGINPALIRTYLEQYRQIFEPMASKQAIANVNAYMVGAKKIPAALAYDDVVATRFMPTNFTVATH